MLNECLSVFDKMLQQKGEGLILDNYIPADGSYVLVDADGKVKDVIEIKLNKKTRQLENIDSEYLSDICFYDYHSGLISMNKPLDSKKVIHSNNYLSFAVKKESLKGKLTKPIIDNYYAVIQNPLKKYQKSKEASRIYQQFADEYGQADESKLSFAKNWIEQNIFHINDILPENSQIDLAKKDYLKIFFEADRKLYEQEDNRYVMPNIYNNNDFNIEYENTIYGLPDNNISMNAKKPFLANRTRKSPIPYLLDGHDVMLQRKFFDYLMIQASLGKYNVYVDTVQNDINFYSDKESPATVKSGIYLRIKKGKELEIQAQDNISNYSDDTKRDFILKHIVQYKFYQDKETNKGKFDDDYNTAHVERSKIGELLNKILFSNYLKTNYYTDANDLKINDSVLKYNLLTYRNIIFDWIYKGIDNNFGDKIDKCAMNIIKGSVNNGYKERAVCQMDLRWSLMDYFKGVDIMQAAEELRNSVKAKILNKEEVLKLDSDQEYCYAIGQLAAYFISLSRAQNKMQSMIKPFLSASSDKVIKERLRILYNKYSYTITENNRRLKNLYAMILAYEPQQIDTDMILLGYMDNNWIYTKSN